MIAAKFKITLSLPSIGRLLSQSGLSCQRPLFRAYQQNPSLVENWLKKEYLQIRALAKKRGAEIYFADEGGIALGSSCGHDVGAEGKDPSGLGQRSAFWPEHDFGDQPAGGDCVSWCGPGGWRLSSFVSLWND